MTTELKSLHIFILTNPFHISCIVLLYCSTFFILTNHFDISCRAYNLFHISYIIQWVCWKFLRCLIFRVFLLLRCRPRIWDSWLKAKTLWKWNKCKTLSTNSLNVYYTADTGSVKVYNKTAIHYYKLMYNI